jgi:hypothetical protein
MAHGGAGCMRSGMAGCERISDERAGPAGTVMSDET